MYVYIQIYIKLLTYWNIILNAAIYTANICIDLPNHILLGRDLGRSPSLSPSFELGSSNLQEVFLIYDLKYL